MSLNCLSDHELIESTKAALQKSREAEVEVLRHFCEIERRRLWIHVDSIYEYLCRTFNLTSDQVYPRLQAMRLMSDIPEIEQKLTTGELVITNVLKAHQIFRAEAKKRRVTVSEKRSVLSALENVSTRNADKVLAQKYPASHKLPEKIKPVSPNRNLLQYYVDDETLAEIEKLKSRYSHQMPGGQMGDLMKILIRIANRQPEPKPRKSRKAEACVSTEVDPKSAHRFVADLRDSSTARSRHIPADVQREMEKSRSKGCQYVSPSGEVCGSHHFLQRDHIHEFSRGGSNTLENLRWLCGFHNRSREPRGRFETRRGARKM
jgi:hypothetical protein